MSYQEPLYSVNDYDFEGDMNERGIFLHFEDTRVKVADSAEEFEEFIKHLQEIASEVKDREDQLQ